jgi:hypothetical protein
VTSKERPRDSSSELTSKTTVLMEHSHLIPTLLTSQQSQMVQRPTCTAEERMLSAHQTSPTESKLSYHSSREHILILVLTTFSLLTPRYRMLDFTRIWSLFLAPRLLPRLLPLQLPPLLSSEQFESQGQQK